MIIIATCALACGKNEMRRNERKATLTSRIEMKIRLTVKNWRAPHSYKHYFLCARSNRQENGQ